MSIYTKTNDGWSEIGASVASAVGGGKVLQVVNGRHAVKASSSSTTFAPTGLTATITPTSATSQILVIVHQTGLFKHQQDIICQLQLVRDGTRLSGFENAAAGTGAHKAHNVGGSGTTYLASPSSTAPVTYSTDFRSNFASGAVQVQCLSSESTITLMEVSA